MIIFGNLGCFQVFGTNYSVLNMFVPNSLFKSLIIFSGRISRNRIPGSKDIEFLKVLDTLINNMAQMIKVCSLVLYTYADHLGIMADA